MSPRTLPFFTPSLFLFKCVSGGLTQHAWKAGTARTASPDPGLHSALRWVWFSSFSAELVLSYSSPLLYSPGWPRLLCRGRPWEFDLPEDVLDCVYSTSKFSVVLGSNKCCASILNNWASVFILAIQWFLIVGFNLHFLMADAVQDFSCGLLPSAFSLEKYYSNCWPIS